MTAAFHIKDDLKISTDLRQSGEIQVQIFLKISILIPVKCVCLGVENTGCSSVFPFSFSLFNYFTIL